MDGVRQLAHGPEMPSAVLIKSSLSSLQRQWTHLSDPRGLQKPTQERDPGINNCNFLMMYSLCSLHELLLLRL